MSINTTTRQAGVDEIAAEMDRRGKVIEHLEARLAHIDGIYLGAIDNLLHHQIQLDMDGVNVGVSRQALCEVLAGVTEAHTSFGGYDPAIQPFASPQPTEGEPSEAEGWRSMDSAPRDGTRILVCRKRPRSGSMNKNPAIGSWNGLRAGGSRPGWVLEIKTNTYPVADNALLGWMPLPATPLLAAKSKGGQADG